MKKIILGSIIVAMGLMANDFQSGLKDLNGKKDFQAYKTFFSLAKSGDVDSQTLLGEMYLDGIGTQTDIKKAFYWLSKAANSGDPEAEYLLGFMYENGIKVAINMPRAVSLYEKSAKKGDVLAQYSLAMIYKEGREDIPKDMDKAIKWLVSVQKSQKGLEYQARVD